MCRLYGFRATERTKVECSLAHAQNALLAQSRQDHKSESHPDGWGIAFYRNGEPRLERYDKAAYKDIRFGALAERVFSHTVIAHVRLATIGTPAPQNTHPFVYGRWTFAHNGTVTAFRRVRPRIEAELEAPLLAVRRGDTDSELAFLWILSRLGRAGLDLQDPDQPVDGVARVLAESVRILARWSEESGAKRPAKLNLLLTDGSVLLATRWGRSLWWLDRLGIDDCEICGIPHVEHQEGAEYRAVVVASEPITDEPWHEVPERHIFTADADLQTAVRPL